VKYAVIVVFDCLEAIKIPTNLKFVLLWLARFPSPSEPLPFNTTLSSNAYLPKKTFSSLSTTHPPPLGSRNNHLQQLFETRRPQPSHRIPSFRGVPACVWDSWDGRGAVIFIASLGSAVHDIGQSLIALGIQPRVQETQRRFPGRQACIV
jgi:hypothetical protein